MVDDLFDRSTAGRGVLGKVVGAVQGAPSESDLTNLAGDLFAVVDALDSSVALRRAMTDPSTSEQGRRQLVHDLLDGKASRPAVRLVAEAAALRWTSGRALAVALERQAVRAQLINAEGAAELENTEDELFRFARIVEANPELRNALGDRSVALSRRRELVGELLAGRATEATVVLAKRAVGRASARSRTPSRASSPWRRRSENRVVATVRVAQPLTAEQRDQLRTSLSRQLGREVAVQEVVDPDVLGGVRVELGDEVIEGTVAGRLEQARRLFG